MQNIQLIFSNKNTSAKLTETNNAIVCQLASFSVLGKHSVCLSNNRAE